MSFHVTALVMRTKFGNSQRKCIALKLADCANDDGSKIFPAIATIVDHSEAGERTTQRTLKEWCDDGLLVLDKAGGKGPKDPNEYSFNMEILNKITEGELIFEAYKSQKLKKWRLTKPSKKGAK